MLKSPRVELIVMALLMLLAMAGFWWMQHHDPKVKPAVAIQDGKTIDFSTGRPIVKDDAKQKAAIEKSVKEMDAAAANVTFTPKAPAEKRATEPSPAPPK